MEHILLRQHYYGYNLKMKGNVGFCYLLVNVPEKSWDAQSKEEFIRMAKQTSDFFMKEASGRGVPLTIHNYMRTASLSHSVRCSDDFDQWIPEILKQLNFTDMKKMWDEYTAQFNVEDIAFCLAFPIKGRSFAVHNTATKSNFAVVFCGDGEPSVAHEICHLYGAVDYYYPEEVRTKAKQYLGNSVMMDIRQLVIDDFTAYVLGWETQMNNTVKMFLRDTQHLTHEDMSAALKKNTVNGYCETTTEAGTYKGNMKDGFYDGFGSYRFADGSYYEGDWKDNKQEGHGRMFYANGDRYDGAWKNGKINGYGTIYYTDGSHYEGFWKDGQMDGKGIYFYANGARYEGMWKDNKQNGYGVLIYGNGDKYEGNWQNGKQVGIAVYTYANGVSRKMKDGKWF